MNRPKAAPLSKHASLMTYIFEVLSSSFPENRLAVSDDEQWTNEAREVLAALDAFADEQVES